jgi:hypothetical protein
VRTTYDRHALVNINSSSSPEVNVARIPWKPNQIVINQITKVVCFFERLNLIKR